MAPPRPGAGDELGLGEVWGIEGGVVDEALGAQALELPIVISSLQASLIPESAIYNKILVPGAKSVLYW